MGGEKKRWWKLKVGEERCERGGIKLIMYNFNGTGWLFANNRMTGFLRPMC